MERHSAPLLRKLATIVSGDLREAVEETTSNWEETLALILTYAREEEFVPLCQQLSARLERLGLRDAALLCTLGLGTLRPSSPKGGATKWQSTKPC